jgi:hypothetical protein
MRRPKINDCARDVKQSAIVSAALDRLRADALICGLACGSGRRQTIRWIS